MMARPIGKLRTLGCKAVLIGAIFQLMVSPAVRAQGGGFDAEFTLSREASVVVLEYSREIGAIEESDPRPFLRLYGDGRYVVHYPHYMKRAGDWQGRVTTNELRALVQSAIAGQLLEFDARAVEAERRSLEAARRRAARAAGLPQLFAVSDEESTRVRLRVESYKPAGVIGLAGSPLDKEILWWGLRNDVRLYPQIEILQELASLESRIRALAEAPGLEPLDQGTP